MAFEIHYFHERVYADVHSWPVDVLADLRGWLNFSRSMGQVFACHIHAPLVTGCSSDVRVGDRALVGRFIVF